YQLKNDIGNPNLSSQP
ncbi:hypothetical protein CISIN_1g0479152mg, partial [Citrus sinensis]